MLQYIIHSTCSICPPIRLGHSFSLTAKFSITLLHIFAGIALINLVKLTLAPKVLLVCQHTHNLWCIHTQSTPKKEVKGIKIKKISCPLMICSSKNHSVAKFLFQQFQGCIYNVRSSTVLHKPLLVHSNPSAAIER